MKIYVTVTVAQLLSYQASLFTELVGPQQCIIIQYIQILGGWTTITTARGRLVDVQASIGKRHALSDA